MSAGSGEIVGGGRWITLLTDYGSEAGFVGALHAVAARIAPAARLIDLDHSIPPQDVRLGALRLERFVPYLPEGVHVAVVDPGVGGGRRAVALKAGRHLFVGPDNGLLVWAAEAVGGPAEAVVLERCFLSPRSRTFDGRDVFVPVAANLSNGVPLSSVGSPLDPADLVRLERPLVQPFELGFQLEVLQADGFGNVQLSGDRSVAEALGLRAGGEVAVSAGGRRRVVLFGETFSDVDPGVAVMLIDSDGQLALSLNGGRADALFGLRAGEDVLIEAAPL